MASSTSLITLASSGVNLVVNADVTLDTIVRIIEKMDSDCTLTIKRANILSDNSIESISKLIKKLNNKKIIFDFSE